MPQKWWGTLDTEHSGINHFHLCYIIVIAERVSDTRWISFVKSTVITMPSILYIFFSNSLICFLHARYDISEGWGIWEYNIKINLKQQADQMTFAEVTYSYFFLISWLIQRKIICHPSLTNWHILFTEHHLISLKGIYAWLLKEDFHLKLHVA
jgi:hypothetical protein